MAAGSLPAASSGGHAESQRRHSHDPNVLGVAFFISSEAIFFVSLIIAFLVYRGRDLSQSAGLLDVPRTAVFTVALLASSGTVMLAERAMQRGSRGGAIAWLAVTIALGAAFIVNQGLEFAGLLLESVTPQTNLWATTFFTLTGFHGLHVLVGLLALTILLGLGISGDLNPRRHPALSAVSLYWHFVDGVWIVVFSLVYLWR